MGLIAELKRRNVIRMAGLYLVGAWVIVQVAGTLLPVFDTPPWLMKALVALLAVGFVPALVFAWVFELTPQGIRRDEEVKPEESIAPQTARSMDRLIMVMLAVALAYFAFDKFVLAPRRDSALLATAKSASEPVVGAKDHVPANAPAANTHPAPVSARIPPKSIAVLAFTDLSPEHDQAYFSDGIAEELLDALAQIKDLQVAGRTSSFYYKGRNEDLRTIGKALGVANVLEGSVRKQGNKVRITAQLIRTDDDFHVWSQSYNGDLTDVFKLQERIARSIADKMQLILADNGAPLAHGGTSNAEAHQQGLRGLYLLNQRGFGNLRSAEVAFKAAVALDPSYADAWAGLAQVYVLLPIYVWTDPDAHGLLDTFPQALDAADQALRLDPRSSTALSARAQIRCVRNFDWSGAEADFRAAIAANPRDVTAHQWYAEMLSEERRPLESKDQYQTALAIDPLSAVLHFSYGASLTYHEKPEAAILQLDQALALSPDFVEPRWYKVWAQVDLGRYDQASATASGLPEPKRRMVLSVISALRDPTQKAEATRLVLAHGGEGVLVKPPLLVRLGESEAAIAELQRLFAEKAPFREYLYLVPQFDPLHEDPRFQVLLKQIGLPRPESTSESPPP